MKREEPILKNKEKKTLFQPKFEEKKKWHIPWYLLGASLLALWWFREKHEVNTTYQEFDGYVRQNKIQSITIRASVKAGVKYYTARIFLKDGQEKVIAIIEPDQFVSNLEKAYEEYSKNHPALFGGAPIEVKWVSCLPSYEQTDVFGERMQRFFGISIHILEIIFVLWLMRRFGITLRRIAASQNEDQSSKTSVKKFSAEKGIKTTFHDIAGCNNQKVEMSEFVDFLKNPKKYEAAGARLPKGALLGGPPGTGKTLMAKACAGESGVPFFYMSGSDFVEKYVGVGASRVRKLFEAARKEAPSIIFIDEIDAVGRERQGAGNQEGDSTLNQLLVEMDGFNSRDKVVVFAATNRADILDKALKRPGRFDRTIEFTLPNKEERVEIFKVHLRKIVTEERLEVISEKLAPICSGFSGADIMNLVNEASIVAGRSSKTAVELEDFEAAMERVVGGLKKVVKLDEEEKYQIAIHEAGKAVVSWYLKYTPALIKMSIIPRSKSNLGFSQYVEYEKKLQTEEELRDLICHKMGGRAAEEVFLKGDFTTSAQKDLRKCYE